MLGYEPPQPKLWKALVGAGVIIFPLLYVADVAIWGHTPGFLYATVATVLTVGLGLRLYKRGTDSLRPMVSGSLSSRRWFGNSWQPPERHESPPDRD